MGNAKQINFFRAFFIGLIGLVLIGTGLIGEANAAVGCASEVQKNSAGAYNGCKVTMGNREFSIGASQSSEEGCSQVCGIMAEVQSARTAKTAQSARVMK